MMENCLNCIHRGPFEHGVNGGTFTRYMKCTHLSPVELRIGSKIIRGGLAFYVDVSTWPKEAKPKMRIKNCPWWKSYV